MIEKGKMGNRGSTLILLVLVVAVVLGGLVAGIRFHHENFVRQLQRHKIRNLSLQVLQDFALLAQKAHERWQSNQPGGCPAPFTQEQPARFCWRPGVTDEKCIRHPLSSPNDAVPLRLCVGEPNGLQVSSLNIEVEKDPYRYWKFVVVQTWREREFFANHYRKKLLGGLHNLLVAQTAAGAHLPTLAGAPNNTIDNVTCTAATVGNETCKRCTNPPAQNLDCILLRACLNFNGCPNPEDWSTQMVGIITK